jgi:tetratricopeptide (TPR) repeat protein
LLGFIYKALTYTETGDIEAAGKNAKLAVEAAMDHSYAQFAKKVLGFTYFLGGDLEEAEKVLQSTLNVAGEQGFGYVSTTCQLLLSPILIAKGNMKQGLELLEKVQKDLITNQRRTWYAVSEHILGEIYAQIATGTKPSLSIIAKNIGFLMKNVPFAAKKAEEHLNKAVELMKEIGAKGFLGPVYLSMGQLYKATKKTEQARQCLLEAVHTFEECGAETYLKQANEVLDSLK